VVLQNIRFLRQAQGYKAEDWPRYLRRRNQMRKTPTHHDRFRGAKWIDAMLARVSESDSYLAVVFVKLTDSAAHADYRETVAEQVLNSSQDEAYLGCLDAPDLIALRMFSVALR